MLKLEVIEPARSEWASSIVHVSKKDGMLPFFVGYEKLHAVTGCDSYPVLRIEKLINSLRDVRISLTLDTNSGYWRVEIAKEHR